MAARHSSRHLQKGIMLCEYVSSKSACLDTARLTQRQAERYTKSLCELVFLCTSVSECAPVHC